MKRSTKTRVISLLLVVMMVLSVCSMTAMAEETTQAAETNTSGVIYENGKFGYNGYYNVISRKDYVLVPGAAYEYEMVLNNNAGNRRQVIHVIEVDPSNPDVSIVPGYYQIDKDLDDEANWSHKELTEMAKYYEEKLGYNIVGGMNTDLYYTTYSPRVLVYNGESIGNFGENVNSDGTALNPTSSILYVFKDAEGNISCDVKAFSKTDLENYLAEGILLHAVGVSFGMTVKDGELVSKTEERTSAAAARSMVGVKEDGTLVICMNDGRGANNSVGFGNFELGESMLALGCQWAANCDGGGSSTFLSKRVGEETFTMRSVPCDGSQRPTAHGIFVASNVGPTGELDVVNVTADYDIFAPNTVYTFGADAIDTHGYAMDMPAGAAWALSDASFGTIAGGKFVSNGTKGEVDVQVISGGQVVGSRTITVADPEVFELSADSTTIPYSTPDKVRIITLPIVAMTGEANVYIDTNAVSVSLSDSAAGTLDGFQFTATEDTSVTAATITVQYGEIVLPYDVSFGKGSEVIIDFESGTREGFVGYAEAKKWSAENGIENGLFDDPYPHDGQMDAFTVATTLAASAENGGQVRNGSHALAWRFDNTDPDFEAWSYYYLYNIKEPIVLRDVENGKLATSLGMWVYIPEDAFVTSSGTGFSFQSILWKKNENGTFSSISNHFMFTSAATGKRTNLNSATNADIPESRWVYASIDISGYDYLCTSAPTSTHAFAPAFLRSYAKPKIANEVTFYIDDITLDYSSAVDDRELPTIAAPSYSSADTAFDLESGAVISGDKFAFSVTVTDNAALDPASGRILVDGIEIKSTVSGSILSSKEDVSLIPGAHTVAFEIKDELGNPALLTRRFTVSGDAVVTLSGHNESGEAPKAQSVYYVDINVADLSSVNKLEAILKLQTANTWELDGAVVASGFKADFDYNEISQLLTVTVEADSDVRAASLDETLVSIPVRVWTYNRYDYLHDVADTAVCSSNKPDVDIECEVVSGVLDGKSFGGAIDVETELTKISSPYHVHDAELTVLNKEATATESGYENRTYCETCQSVVDWGTILAAKGHNYAIVDGQFVCQDDGCGKILETGTGVFELDGDLYYSINGILRTGWQDMGTYEGDDYINGGSPFTMYGYAGSDYKMCANGEYTISGITYTFAEDGTTMGAWTTNATGIRYSVGPSFIKRSWVTLAGEQYYFGEDNYVYTGTRSIPKNRNNLDEGIFWYLFAEDGKYIRDYTDLNGIVEENGALYWVVDGQNAYGGIMYIDGHYYYARSHGQLAMNETYWTTKTNGLMDAGYYNFDAEGRMTNPPSGAVKPHEHEYEAVVTEPTCDEPGYTTYTCSCSDSYTADEVAALGHEYTVFVKTVEPTEEAQGYTVYRCVRCEETENRDFTDYVPPVVDGTITNNGNSLELEGIVYINHYALIDGFGGSDYIEENGGLLIWKNAVTEEEATFENAEDVNPGLVYDAKNDEYLARTDGIPTKEFADQLYLRTYVLAEDGNYHYGDLKPYSVKEYCEGRIANSTSAKMKALAAAMLHYGASAQNYFDYNLDNLANADTTVAPETYDAALIDALVPYTSAPEYTADANVQDNGKALTLVGAILIDFYFKAPADYTDAVLQVWNGSTTDLTEDNISYENDLTYDTKAKEWHGQTDGIFAKYYGKTIYARAKFVNADGAEVYGPIVSYSVEEYAKGRIENSTNAEMVELAKNLVMYGERARVYFG